MILNKDLQLTPESEIKRLNKVIAEKNRCIEAFKKYDAERKEYYSSLEAKYKYMEDEFNRFVKAVDEDCNHTTAKQVSGLLTNFRQFSYGARFNKLQGQIESARVNFAKLKEAFERFVSSESFIYLDSRIEKSTMNFFGITRQKFDRLEKILEKKVD
jgi:hypothetical protein